jgi:hypothetical protein
MARTAYARGLAVTSPDGTTRAIPITASPVVVSRAEIRRRAALSAQLASAASQMARFVLGSPDRNLLAQALSPLERRIAERTYGAARRLATVRVDYFLPRNDPSPRALEINATIPAMQGYSDIAAESWIETVAARAGLSDAQVRRLLDLNGSNACALHQALLRAFALERGGVPRRIALLCRRHDAQITELRYLEAKFRQLGSEAEVVFPDELSGDSAVEARGKAYDLVYRHLFVRRLEENPCPYVEQLFLEIPGRRAVLMNPPASQIEVKTTFALLSRSAQEPTLAAEAGLSSAQLEAVRQSVPWTRHFRRGPATDPSGRQIADLVTWVADRPERFVLKRAWDYGGKAVFIGASAEEPGFGERTRAALGAELGWAQLCRRAAEDNLGGGFVVQELVSTAAERHLICTESGVASAQLHVDFSAYASVGVDPAPDWGGVCRGSPSQIVNIVGGGGVLPLITSEVAEELLSALRGAASEKRRDAL